MHAQKQVVLEQWAIRSLCRNINHANIFTMSTRVNGHRASDMRKFLKVVYSKSVHIVGAPKEKEHSL